MLAGDGPSFILMQTDLAGNQVWAKAYSIPSQNIGTPMVRSMVLLPDGGYIVAGMVPEMFLARISSTGDVLWAKATPGVRNIATKLILTSDNHFVLCGHGADNAFNGLLIKGDLDGTITWSKGYSTDNVISEDFASVVETPDGGFIGFGTLNDQTMSYSFYAVKVDGSGNVVWSNTYGNSPIFTYLSGLDIHAAGDGNYLLTGVETVKFVDGSVGVITKIDPAGAVLWTKKIPAVLNGFEATFGTEVMADQSIRVLGEQFSADHLISMTKDGVPTSTLFYTGSNNRGTQYFASLPDGSLMLSGRASSISGWVMRTAVDGSSPCNDSLGTTDATSFDMPKTAKASAIVANSEFHDVTATVTALTVDVAPVCASAGAVEDNDATRIVLNVYPNPSSDAVTVALAGTRDATTSKIELLDMNGKNVGSYSVTGNELTIHLASIPSGVYLLRWITNGLMIAETKLTVK
jgi:hypothetical protein